ncbi:MAG: ribosome silencing factor [Chloroflexi bacterium]|nr:ribosome silencing factor [Chloroflexota bacterium]
MVYCEGRPSTADGSFQLEAQALARRIVEVASDKQASDIVLLDIRSVATVADYFVVMSTASERQLSAIVRELGDALRNDDGVRPLRVEGQAASGWVLIDYGDVVVHIFSADQRRFYRLEELWSAAVPLVRMQ